MSIKQIHNPWRDNMLPASFRGATFFVESNTTDGGQRVALHEFPKLDVPYAELMGRRAKRFAIRAYCISFPRDDTYMNRAWPLFTRDYRLARDLLQARLDDGNYGSLQLPFTNSPYAPNLSSQITVACERYRLTEEERYGGYCTFDIAFVEAGAIPNTPYENTTQQIIQGYNTMLGQIQSQAAAGAKEDIGTPQVGGGVIESPTFPGGG